MKPSVAFYSFTSCEGCVLEAVNIVPKLLEKTDIKSFKMFDDKAEVQTVDIAFVEGSISTDLDLKELKQIRKQSKIVVELGACANIGWVASELQKQDRTELIKDKKLPHEIMTRARPVHHFIKVDYAIPQCPINPKELERFIDEITAGKKFEIKRMAVCSECPKQGEQCYLNHGVLCLGLITYAGCGALCIKNEYRCEACRGTILKDINQITKVFKARGFEEKEVIDRLKKVTFE